MTPSNPQAETRAPARASAQPPGIAIYQLAIGHYFSRALALAAELRLADLLAAQPRDVEELAKATGTHAPALRRVLRLLASADLLEELEDGRFRLASQGQLLRSDVPGSMRALVQLFAGVGIQDSWKELEFCVRTGQPAYRKDDPDADAFTFTRDPEAGRIFDEAMATFAPQTAAAIAAAYDFSPFTRLMDAGGGNGAILCGILRAYPALRGSVFDLPRVIERTRAKLAAEGLSERCDAIPGSFFDEIPRGADAILSKHVIHDWDDEHAVRILERCRAALPEDGTLLIVEGVYPEHIDASPESRGAAANDVNMLVCTGGRQRSEAEFGELFAKAGFELTRIVPTQGRVSVIEGRPAR